MSEDATLYLTLDEVDDLFEDYSVVDSLESGAQGFVFKVKREEEELFLKIYKPDMKIRAEREVEKLKELDSPYFVDLIDSGNIQIGDKDYYYAVTDFISGENLKNVIKVRKLEDFEMRKLIISMCRAIDQLWENDIVHRDIKPANIMKREDDFILIDLGIAKHHDLSTITKTGMALGTPVYMSPEQLAARKNITLKSDLFSLGIVLYEAYTGQHPYGFEYTMIGRISPTPIKSARLNYDNKIANIINYLLKTRPIDRPFSGKEVIEYLMEGDNSAV
ncbi:serine/threonine protein kinase [Halanaerobium congolense]|jgi:serine/threonine-protein kinase|uniref:non-specific serine/threonine protein kinase n=1 Tax=Halanaerobium congolense TaxID=54121 RepID=A0A4R7DYE2_9FIRM|nr:serine/threonine-protein kinase [Halanaerobium congolense]TDS25642.1 protein kinase-like protein [Halanaerobium congolense]